MAELMGIVNLTPDSFCVESRAEDLSRALVRIRSLVNEGASIIDLGAVSTRPGAEPVTVDEEWTRLRPVLEALSCRGMERSFRISVDTTRSEIVRRAYEITGPFIVNDISAGEDDPSMLMTAGRLGLQYVAMHKRGTPQTMDAMCEYPRGVIRELLGYFQDFAQKAAEAGIVEWILDPGLGFAKTSAQCWEILEDIEALKVFGRPVLVGAADKRFTAEPTEAVTARYGLQPGNRALGTALAHSIALEHGADMLRVHRI